MGKILMWFVAIIAGFVFYKAAKARKSVDNNKQDRESVRNQRHPDTQLDGRSEGPTKTEAMLLCGVCGVHLPASETKTSNGIISCSDTHACSNKNTK
jgi:hypothetical protein